MLDIKTDIPVKQDCIEAIQDKFSQIRDLMSESELLLKSAINPDDTLLTQEEVANFLRCDTKHIPRQIPRFRSGGKVLFQQSDVNNFIKMKLKKN